MYACGTPEYKKAVWTKGTPEYVAARTPGSPQAEWHRQQYKQNVAAILRDKRREDRRSGIKAFFGGLWHFVVTAGMFSSDPTTARQAMVIRAQEELKNQREISQSNRQLDRAQREEDMRVLARVFVDEVERRR